MNDIIDSHEEVEFLNAYIYENMINYIDIYKSDISLMNFDTVFYENLKELCKIFIEHYYSITIDDSNDIEYDDLFENIWKNVSKIFYKNIIPKRSYKTTFIRNKNINKSKLKKKIEILRNIPQPDQRTEAWYSMRYNLITASNAYKCFENETSRNSIIYEKCKPYESKTENVFATLNTSLHWGQKFEPLSVSIYEKRFNTIIEDFGCLPHNHYKFLGASPDGINVDINNDRYGRMLEIKNIVNRDIVDDPKKEYWVQMQLQMEVCNLNECDFLETRFKEYENYDEFKNDGTFTHTVDGLEKGVMILFIKNERPLYEYSPLGMNEEDYTLWEKHTIDLHENDEFISINYWYLHEFSCKLVLRNKKWFNDNIHAIKETWDIIEHDRINGYDHRAPQKRIKKENNSKIQGCLINISGNINEALDNINTVTNIIEIESKNDECKESKTEEIKSDDEIKDQLKLNRFKVHTESFDETHMDIL